jgi:hypothetical protein
LVALSDHVNNANPIFADRAFEPRTEPIAPPVQHFMADLDPAPTQRALKLKQDIMLTIATKQSLSCLVLNDRNRQQSFIPNGKRSFIITSI